MFRYFLDLLFPPRGDESAVRDIGEDEFLSLLAPQLIEKTEPQTVALLPYADTKVRSVIHEAKYHGNEKSFMLLGQALVEYLRDEKIENPIFVPIPLGAKRRKTRGFNQVEEVLVRAAKELHIPIEADLLTRTRETISQVSLPRFARAENMRGAFRCPSKALAKEGATHTYIVVDDVVTTGATLQSAISALKTAGAKNIIPIALAH